MAYKMLLTRVTHSFLEVTLSTHSEFGCRKYHSSLNLVFTLLNFYPDLTLGLFEL